MYRKLIVTSILLLVGSTLSILAQLTFSGNILAHDGSPLPYASVFVEDMKMGVVANDKGHFEIVLPKGNHNMRFSYIGFTSYYTVVKMEDRSFSHDFNLQEEVTSLDDIVVLPGGKDFATYLMEQLDNNIKPLKRQLSSYDCTTTASFTKHIDLSTLKKKGLIHFTLAMMSWGKIFNMMVKYPDLAFTLSENVHFSKGKISHSKLNILKTTPRLTDSELNSISKKDWFLDSNQYDEFYDLVHKKIKELKKKHPKYKLHYKGSYEEGGRTIHIVEYGKTHVEIVDKIWQIRRIRYKSSTRTILFEFQQLVPNVYLPTSGYAEYNIDYDGYPKGTVNLAMSHKYSNLRK